MFRLYAHERLWRNPKFYRSPWRLKEAEFFRRPKSPSATRIRCVMLWRHCRTWVSVRERGRARPGRKKKKLLEVDRDTLDSWCYCRTAALSEIILGELQFGATQSEASSRGKTPFYPPPQLLVGRPTRKRFSNFRVLHRYVSLAGIASVCVVYSRLNEVSGLIPVLRRLGCVAHKQQRKVQRRRRPRRMTRC